ncbi:MAG: hypothetical protein HXO50_05105 [Prevotella sp.]|jgi:hypothetical protein|nr:hypothetical protein [Prevotella sp.]
MIERNSIIKLLGNRNNVYHSTVLTCYNFDPIFFESIYLPTLRRLGVMNVVVFMDATMYDALLDDVSYCYHRVGSNGYTLVRQQNFHKGVFHPKIALLVGDEEGTLIIGSGNLTFSGLSNNDEVWNVFHAHGNSSVHFPLLHQVWEYLLDVTNDVPELIRRQLDWVAEQGEWLLKESDVTGVTLASGEECRLLYNSDNSSIAQTIYESVRNAPVSEITTVAPFYDTDGEILKELLMKLKPHAFNCVIDLERQSAPYALLKDSDEISFSKYISANPLHAKIIEIQGNDETWLISGSANMGRKALGSIGRIYNDEMCVMLHSQTKRNYISELGIECSLIKSKERKSILPPEQTETNPSSKLVSIISAEEKDNKLLVHFSKTGVDGMLAIWDVQLHIVQSSKIKTSGEVVVELDGIDSSALHMVALLNGAIEISNRSLVIREQSVESCNPDPNRRKLSSLLEDGGLLENLSHIFGYIEFDDSTKVVKAARTTADGRKREKEDNTVTRDRFEELKDSSLSISLHSGVRILSFLQQILFNVDKEVQTEDELRELSEIEEKGGEDETVRKEKDGEAIKSEVARIRGDVMSFEKKMLQFLYDKTKDKSIHGERHPAIMCPTLVAEPGLNASSSLAVLSIAVVYMMNKYGSHVQKTLDIRNMLLKCGGLFYSLYSNRFPTVSDRKSQKVNDMLKDASVNLLIALSFFSFRKDDAELTRLVLNCLDAWQGRDELSEIIPLYYQQIAKLNQSHLQENTIDRIRQVAMTYLQGDVPVEEFTSSTDRIFQYRKGHGFLYVDGIKRQKNGWSFTSHSSWFEDKADNQQVRSGNALKYKGYSNI